MGDILAWRVVPVPANGQISNVSAFVLPRRAGMADHEQVPMFPEGSSPDPFKQLVDVLRLQASALNQVIATNRELAQRLDHVTLAAREGLERVAEQQRPHRPQQKELRVYASCCAYLRRIEADVRQEHLLGPTDEVTKEMLFAAGGPNPRTLNRIMTETYGLELSQWPPSTWPEQPPRDPWKAA